MAKVGVEETEHKEGARGGQTGRFNAVNGFRKNWEWEEESERNQESVTFHSTSQTIYDRFSISHNGQNNILRQEEYTEVPSKKPLQRNYPIVPSAIDSNLPV